jgi:hypothetical protein
MGSVGGGFEKGEGEIGRGGIGGGTGGGGGGLCGLSHMASRSGREAFSMKEEGRGGTGGLFVSFELRVGRPKGEVGRTGGRGPGLGLISGC